MNGESTLDIVQMVVTLLVTVVTGGMAWALQTYYREIRDLIERLHALDTRIVRLEAACDVSADDPPDRRGGRR